MRQKSICSLLLVGIWLVCGSGDFGGTLAWSARPKSVGNAKPSRLQAPVRVVRRPGGKLLITDYRQRMVFTVHAKTLGVRGAFRVGGGPVGIAWTTGRVYVGNQTSGRVQVYDPSGQWLFDLGGSQGQVTRPTDIAIDADLGRVFVVDSAEKVVKVFNADGPLLDSFPGSGSNQLANPTGIAVDPSRREVLVSDHGDPVAGIDPSVRIFNYTGQLLREISGKVSGGMLGSRFQFSRPQGLAVDGKGHVFVVASLLGRVLIFDQVTGEQLASLGSYGTDPGQLAFPLDVAIDPRSDDVFVTNNRTGRIEVFRKGAVLP